MMKYLERFYPESRFGGFTDVDGTIAFYTRVNSLFTSASIVLDFGCGRGAFMDDSVAIRRELRMLKGKCARVIGLDVDGAGQNNQSLDEFRILASNEAWPLEDRSIDLIVCDWVMEHLPDAQSFFSQAKRVLRPGGRLCIRTANAYSYVGILSKLIPNRLHVAVLRRAQDSRKANDVFPTVYRCNTVFRLRAMMAKNGFENVVYGYEAEPYYLEFSIVLYALGVLHQKFAPHFWRLSIFAFGQLEGPVTSPMNGRATIE